MDADLHNHTTASDGLHSPQDVVKMAKEAGLRAIALTDHDTVAGIDEAQAAGKRWDVEVVSGVEVSTVYEGQDIHILGYAVDHRNPVFLERLERLRNTRDLRNRMIIDKLNELGISITEDDVYRKKRRASGNVGRPHIAEVLMDRKWVHSMEEAFATYLGKHGKAYANPPRISPFEAVDWILEAGGVPVLAHPGLYDDDRMIEALIEYGLYGIEVSHPDHTDAEEAKYRAMATDHSLIQTAGSDFHGERNGKVFHDKIGSQRVSLKQVEKLKGLARDEG